MKKDKNQSVIKRTFDIAKKGKGTLIISCVVYTIGMVSGIVPYLAIYFIAKQLLAPAMGSNTASVLQFWIITAGCSILVNLLFTFLGSLGCHKVAFRILYDFRINVMEHIGKLSLGFFADRTTGSIQKTMDENIERIEGFIAHMLPNIVGSLAVTIVLFVSLFILNVWIALTSLVTIVIAIGFQKSIFGGKKAREVWEEVSVSAAQVTGAFSEYIKGMAEVKLFGMTGTVTGSIEKFVDNYKLWELKQYKRSIVPMSLYKALVLSMVSIAMPVCIIVIKMNPGNETFLAVLMAVIIIPGIYDPLMESIFYGSQTGELTVRLNAIDELLSLDPLSEPMNPKTPSSWTVEFKDVTFSYNSNEENSRPALSNVSFCALQNKMTALVGPSGGGKTTIGQLLSRFWDIEHGSITIGDIDIREISQQTLMDSIATVFQETYIFADTIWNNITMNRNYSKEDVYSAAEAAQCHDFITAMPNGYDTRIGSGGNNLSGGEAQRVSIARAILKDAPIIVLDEALAYSDAENEKLIQEAIRNLIKDKTVLMIAHRLKSISYADQILVLIKGQIIDKGKHETLLQANEEYKILWELQNQADEWIIDSKGN